MAEKIIRGESLFTSFDKVNDSIENSNTSKAESALAVVIANTADGKSDSTQTQLNNIVIESGTSDAETMQARGTEDLLYKRLDKSDKKISDIAVNLDANYPRLALETNDLARLQRAVAGIPLGATLLTPNAELDLNGSDIVINRSINIVGKQRPFYDYVLTNAFITGSRLKNGGFIFEADNITVDGVGTDCPTLDNGFQANTVGISNLLLKYCVSNSRDHGFLFESYQGTVKNAKVLNCIAHNSIHGFISKSENTIFTECLAESCTSSGFGIISDNIPGATKKGIAKHNSLINCYADSCYSGFKMYARDMYSSTNSNAIRSSSHSLTNCHAINCTEGYAIGDSAAAPVGTTYIAPFDINIVNCHHEGTIGFSFNINLVDRITIDNISIERIMNVNYTLAKNVYIGKVNSYLEKIGQPDEIDTLTVGNSSPTLASGKNIFKLNNPSTQNIYHFAGGKDRKLITILFMDDTSIITNGGNFKLNRGSYSGKGSWLVLKLQNGAWEEVAGHRVAFGSIGLSLATSGTVDLSKGSVFDVSGSGTTANKITVTNKLQDVETLTIIIRSTSGSFTYGGFDTTKFIVPTSFPVTTGFGTAIISQWVYMSSVTKWVCVSQTTAPYV